MYKAGKSTKVWFAKGEPYEAKEVEMNVTF